VAWGSAAAPLWWIHICCYCGHGPFQRRARGPPLTANEIPTPGEGHVTFTLGPPDPCDGKSTVYQVRDFQTKNDGVVHLLCGSWNGRSGWGFRKIEAKHFPLHGLIFGPANIRLMEATLKDPGTYRVEPTNEPGVDYAVYEKEMVTCYCGATVTMRIVINRNTANIITAYKLPYHDH
jgi:hypothetical protein